MISSIITIIILILYHITGQGAAKRVEVMELKKMLEMQESHIKSLRSKLYSSEYNDNEQPDLINSILSNPQILNLIQNLFKK